SGEILDVQVDLARFQGRLDDLARAEVQLPLDTVAVGLERLAVQLGEDRLLGEVRRAELQGRLAAARRPAGRAGGRERDQRGQRKPRDRGQRPWCALTCHNPSRGSGLCPRALCTLRIRRARDNRGSNLYQGLTIFATVANGAARGPWRSGTQTTTEP